MFGGDIIIIDYDSVENLVMLDNTDELAFEVEFLSCVVDKKRDFLVVDADSHFCDFVGVHYSKIKQGKLSLLDLLIPQSRQEIVRKLCKKDSPYVYFDLYIMDNSSKYNYVHCTARNNENDSLCEITFADVGKSEAKSKKLREKAKTMNHLIELVTGGVCLFKVNPDMHFEALYANEACCKIFGTTKQTFNDRVYRIDDLIHPDDKSAAFQAIGVCMATQKPIDMELRIIRHKGEYIWCKLNAGIQRYDKDNSPIFHAMFTNISALKKAQDEADRQGEYLLKVLKNVPGPVFCTSYENPFEYTVVSENFIKNIGYSRKQLFEEYDGNMLNIIADEDIEKVRKYFEKIPKDTKLSKITYRIKTKFSQHITVYDTRKVIVMDDGMKSMIGILTDRDIDDYFKLNENLSK